MRNSPVSNRTLGLLVILTWMSYAMYLYPLPADRIEQTPAHLDTSGLEWITEEQRSRLESEYAEARNQIRCEWIFTLALSCVGVGVGVFCWRAVKYSRYGAFVVASIYIYLWVVKYSTDAKKSLVEAYIYQWELAGYLDGIVQYVALAYFDGVLFLVQIALVLWIIIEFFAGSRSPRNARKAES